MKVTIYSDGGSRGNPGEAAIGYVIRQQDCALLEYAEPIGIATNNVAEYQAVLKAIQRAKLLGANEIDLFLDSELIQRQLIGVYKVKSQDLAHYYHQITEEIKDLKKFNATHVKRELNKDADRLVNEALDGKQIVDRVSFQEPQKEFNSTQEEAKAVLTERFDAEVIGQNLASRQPQEDFFDKNHINREYSSAEAVSKYYAIAGFLVQNGIVYQFITESEGICIIGLSVAELKRFSQIFTQESYKKITQNHKIKIRLELM